MREAPAKNITLVFRDQKEHVMKNIWQIFVIILAVLPLTLAGCGGGSDGGSVAEGPSTGRLSISITDAPVDEASSVVVEFWGVEIKPEEGDSFIITFSPRQIDLQLLSGVNSEDILVNEVLDAGHYEWMRLLVNAACNATNSFIVTDKQYPLGIPSGDESGLKLNRGFDVPAGGAVEFTVDFDLRKSVNGLKSNGNCAGHYKLRPTLRIVDNTEIGSISGTVADGTLKDVSCTAGNVVYVFEGLNITPDDIDTIDLTDVDPITTAMVDVVDLGGGVLEGTYSVNFLSAGDYTVAFTCQAEDDDPEVDETLTTPIVFLGAANVTVLVDTDTTHNF